jgi:hypothetical protein
MPLRGNAMGSSIMIIRTLKIHCIPKMVCYILNMMRARGGIRCGYGLKRELYKPYWPALKA